MNDHPLGFVIIPLGKDSRACVQYPQAYTSRVLLSSTLLAYESVTPLTMNDPLYYSVLLQTMNGMQMLSNFHGGLF